MTVATLTSEAKTRSRGRPREFDMDAALDSALRVFSERGYHATSISDLTEAMDLASGSIYKAFKDKRGVFLAAFGRYRRLGRRRLEAMIASAETGRDKVFQMVMYYTELSYGEAGRKGCLVVGGANDFALLDEEAAAHVVTAFAADEKLMADLIRIGQADGSIPKTVDPDAAALAFLCFTKGLRVIGKTGRSREEMMSAAEAAMKLVT
ncbi:TetR/AcrR family transcriptional regulator [Rhizobium laguerreae]|uniref:TetR/AcrR family transcriptional regulator n=1 Tax=Rhizobium laguerreae TaxID=1076926 RepID=UPI001C907D03|nr:TetR/AcrR family transcriptional regulator [Rhizobium laguerreae]MBY3342940.1 TetR/AcrR family transcriptional regulator [Rhizobium laguerreae]MBY3349974.1 TetR/AcrR family transcriptional regulator [Rhizobium laguerreae]MBY3371078.1 TetR/AcrR family transcriptional regulator [Rhizobium laguerreae]MBY3426318.1 TetR/AcrR family transcriptional regulator [Rhizobium laguerreae]MBY3434130.1 TetR/AcrR family transcriptional regulator [Rhizobium laguerreae]